MPSSFLTTAGVDRPVAATAVTRKASSRRMYWLLHQGATTYTGTDAHLLTWLQKPVDRGTRPTRRTAVVSERVDLDTTQAFARARSADGILPVRPHHRSPDEFFSLSVPFSSGCSDGAAVPTTGLTDRPFCCTVALLSGSVHARATVPTSIFDSSHGLLAEISRVLRPGGILFLEEIDVSPFAPAASLLLLS